MDADIFYLKVGITLVCFYLILPQTYIDCLSIFYLKVGIALWYVFNSYLLEHTSVCFYLIFFHTYIDCLSIFYLEVGFALWYVSTSVTLIYFSLSLLHTSLGHILTTFSRYGISYFIVCQTYFCDFGMFRYVADLEFLRHISPNFSRYSMSYSTICQAYFLDIFWLPYSGEVLLICLYFLLDIFFS